MGILTDVGVLAGGKITPAAREKFIDDVNVLLLNGFDGKIFGIADIAGDTPDLVFQGSEQLSGPFTLKPIEEHQKKFPTFHKFFIDILFEKTAVALDVPGATPLAPVFDPTVAFAALPLKPGIGLPEILARLPVIAIPPSPFDLFDIDITDVGLLAELALKIPKPSIPMPPSLPLDLPGIGDLAPPLIVPPSPDIQIVPPGLPNIPSVPPLHLPNVKMYNIIAIVGCIFAAVIKAIVLIVTIKALEMVTALAEKAVIGLIAFVAAELLINIIACLTGLNLKNALSFVAAFVVYLERVIGMICTDVVGLVLGSPGLITKGVAQFVNLV